MKNAVLLFQWNGMESFPVMLDKVKEHIWEWILDHFSMQTFSRSLNFFGLH